MKGHTAILEPDRFLRDYVLWESRRQGKKWEAFAEVNGSKTILTDNQYTQAIAMRDAVAEHPEAGPLMKKRGDSEVTVIW